MSMDITEFYQTFFDEADELLADMEQHLLLLDPEQPDTEQLNAIFRAAHSIKGGAATFNFTVLQQTTHLLENLLDSARKQELHLSTGTIDIFLQTKDIMKEQLAAYKNSEDPDEESFEHICQVLRGLTVEAQTQAGGKDSKTVTGNSPETSATITQRQQVMPIRLSRLKPDEIPLMLEELGNLGTVQDAKCSEDSIEVQLMTSASQQDISAVLCFVLEQEQISFITESATATNSEPLDVKAAENPPPVNETKTTVATPAAGLFKHASTVAVNSPLKLQPTMGNSATAVQSRDDAQPLKPRVKANTSGKSSESSSIRVAVEKVDQLINLVGELVITQSMLVQRSDELDPVIYSALLSNVSQLVRNARDLQDSVMSIRMMPMEYVFSRYPRLVRDLATKLNKEVELKLSGSSTELDKSLIERIIDPLTHLVRNSLDHGIENPEQRLAAGKNATGTLTLSAEHQGGNICIEVTDDGAGLDHTKILAKAAAQGLLVHDNMSDEDIGLLIFAPGFSTAEQVTDVSGRGVGMDVVRRNIQEMGGHVQVSSQQGNGTTIRILLPLTLAILDGMSVKVGDEVFILPLTAVIESLQPRAEDLHPFAGNNEQVLHVRGEYLPLIELYRVFDIANAKTDATKAITVVLESAGRRYALLVDQLIGQHQVVVKNLESNYRKVPGISAATIMGDGSVALIIDVPGLQALNREKDLAVSAA